MGTFMKIVKYFNIFVSMRALNRVKNATIHTFVVVDINGFVPLYRITRKPHGCLKKTAATQPRDIVHNGFICIRAACLLMQLRFSY